MVEASALKEASWSGVRGIRTVLVFDRTGQHAADQLDGLKT
ncbi:hypothetical protein [Rhodoblastus acidophilus]|nr:hypothetical protein [Rhodoblastus acidophilus]MCW2319219.1 hypothetical protein [Rhodoblastus acidophilus]